MVIPSITLLSSIMINEWKKHYDLYTSVHVSLIGVYIPVYDETTERGWMMHKFIINHIIWWLTLILFCYEEVEWLMIVLLFLTLCRSYVYRERKCMQELKSEIFMEKVVFMVSWVTVYVECVQAVVNFMVNCRASVIVHQQPPKSL